MHIHAHARTKYTYQNAHKKIKAIKKLTKVPGENEHV